MAGVTVTGLSKAIEICRNRSQRVKELKETGKPVIGYLCIYPVLEMITAFDMIPYRIFGDMDEPITDADDYMPSIVCPFLRSILDLGLKDRYDFRKYQICFFFDRFRDFQNRYKNTRDKNTQKKNDPPFYVYS